MKIINKILLSLGRLFVFAYFWILLLMSVEIVFRVIFVKQKMYQLPFYWIILVIALNAFLITMYVKGVVKRKAVT